MERNYTDYWEHRIKETFASKEKKDSEYILWHIISLLLYQDANDTTLIEVFKLFNDKSNFVKLVSLLDGRNFRAPTKRNLEEKILLAVLYYEREINNKSWEQIKKEFDFDFSTVKYGIRIKNLDNWMKQKINEIVRLEECNE